MDKDQKAAFELVMAAAAARASELAENVWDAEDQETSSEILAGIEMLRTFFAE